MILLAVEFLQLGQRAQPAVHAVLVKQQARLVKLRIPPILLLYQHLSLTFLLVQTPQNLFCPL